MRRRDFVASLAGVLAGIAPARAQREGHRRRIGVLMGLVENDPQARKYLNAFREVLSGSGWKDQQNLLIDFRAATKPEIMQSLAFDLINLGAEIILTYTTPCTNAVHQATSTVPILFVAVSDPVGTGFVRSFSHPGETLPALRILSPRWVANGSS